MLPRTHRLHRSADFATVVRKGARKGRRTMVVHAHVDSSDVRVGGPRFGLVVSKAVGDSVTRHRVSRRLRHIASEVLPGLESDLLVVVRANPAAVSASHADLLHDMRTGLTSAVSRAREARR
ncbi:ribonuclease P protein component [Dietzia natronolimnaea]|uniref:Ribonuclease P protein component n=1 Tax=Dietzia natronolimnaea TaxID=161920 RepID=A0A2A2WRY3_9ACTN|nr:MULTISPECIES: ribonuclease P protein component [Dietzia]PAY23915.1 ribonuclease P protein component [Dietzia natronolimnaea]